MKIQSPGDPLVSPVPRPKWLPKIFLAVFLLLVGVGSTLVFVFQYMPPRTHPLWSWAQDRGYAAFDNRVRLRQALAQLPLRFLESSVIDSPTLHLDVKFKHLQKLRKKRAEALAMGQLVQGPNDFVPAAIRYGAQNTKVKLRLKGDLPDHLQGNKWSFRVQVKGEEHIWGMRRFSLQNPQVRWYQSEALFLETLRHLGVLAPRYEFVEVKVNGEAIGVMALEEHFSKELLEANGRKASVILKWDERLVWASSDGFAFGWGKKGAFDDFRNARIDVFQSNRIAKSAPLAKEYATATGLLRGFVNKNLSASEVFDVKLMGKFLAAGEVWGAWHGLRWNNLRFYFNPLTAKLEPIGYDISGKEGLLTHLSKMFTKENALVKAMFEDPDLLASYHQALQSLIAQVVDGSLLDHLKQVEAKQLPILQREFYFLRPYPLEKLTVRAKNLMDSLKNDTQNPPSSIPEYPTLVHAHIIESATGPYLEIANAVPHEVEVQAIHVGLKRKTVLEEFQPHTPVTFPLRLPARTPSSVSEARRVYYRPPSTPDGYSLHVRVNIKGGTQSKSVAARPYHEALTVHPVPVSPPEEQLAHHPFLSLEQNQQALRVKPGQWQVSGSLVVPKGYSLTIPAGTTLRFPSEGALIAHGPLYFEGTELQGIVLEPTPRAQEAGGWQGVAVLEAEGSSQWTHVAIRNTSGVQRAGWALTGGVTFYKSDIHLADCRFEGTHAEDALNIVQATFDLKNLIVQDTVSDAFDADFTKGTVEGGLFHNIGTAGGGDAIDISGSTVTVRSLRFRNVQDKALSVGEGSHMVATHLTIEQVGTGAASKDGSVLHFSNSSVEGTTVAGLLAYMKKPEYGPATIKAVQLEFDSHPPPLRAQTGSVITIDGKIVESEEMDVKDLYHTVMKPGLRP